MSNAARRTDNYLSSHRLGDLFSQSHEKGVPNLPIVSLTMDRGLVLRDDVERRVETALPPEGHRLVRKGELAYNMMRMWQGVCRAATFDCLISPAYVVLHPRSGVDATFAEYLLRFEETVASFRRLSFGVVDDRLRLYFKDFRRVEVAIPSSENVQRKIARILTTVDNLIEKTESLIAKYQATKQGMMHDLFSRGVDANGHLRPTYEEAPDLYKPSGVGWIPKEWDIVPLRTIVQIGNGVTLGRKLPKHQTVDVPYLRVANVQDGYLDLSEIKTVSVMKEEVEGFSLRTGDVLLTEGGDFDKLGRGWVWNGQIDPCLHQNHIFRIRPDLSVMDPEYLATLAGSPYGKAYFQRSSKQTTNLATINSTQLKAFPVILPPLPEQNRIVTRLAIIRSRIETETGLLNKRVTLKSGLKQDLLTGKVRVKVDESEGQ
jgi:type I restriction enzyme S subunit